MIFNLDMDALNMKFFSVIFFMPILVAFNATFGMDGLTENEKKALHKKPFFF